MIGSAGDCQLSQLSLVGSGATDSIGGCKQHLIDATRVPHVEVVNQILRTSVITHDHLTGDPSSTTAGKLPFIIQKYCLCYITDIPFTLLCHFVII